MNAGRGVTSKSVLCSELLHEKKKKKRFTSTPPHNLLNRLVQSY